MAEYHKYSIKQNRFKRSLLAGLEVEGNKLQCKKEVYHRIFACDSIDGVEDGALWGRFHAEWSMDEDMVVTVWTAASDQKEIWWNDHLIHIEDMLKDPRIEPAEKTRLMEALGAKRQTNRKDILLYELEGRYFYLLIEIKGLGNGELKDLFVNNQGDIFIDTFPEIYREYGNFFHRYMSMFSSIYMDFQEKIDNVAELLDIDTAPVEILPVFCRWMGLDVSGDFLTEDRLRTLVREAYHLNRTKGTRETLLRVCEIVLGEKVVILEKNVLRESTQAEDQRIYEDLYGKGIYDVTLLVRTYVPENQKSQLMFLLNQFKPVRSCLKIKFLEQRGNMDGHVYMDMNAHVMDTQSVVLDDRAGLDDNIMLKE